MRRDVFVVNCERIGRRKAYRLRFPFNEQLVQRIKNLPEETRKWNPSAMVWELTTYALFSIIKKYSKSNKIYFDFNNQETRKIFIKQVNDIKVKANEKRKFIADLNIKKEQWVEYKNELEKTYNKYSDKLHSFLKEGIKLYPHQIVAAMFMNVTRNTLISHDMGIGKTLSSIVYVEMNGFEKVIVITPNSLKFNYYNEVLKFTDSTAHIVGWKKNTCGIDNAKYVIINYEFFNPSRSKKAKDDRFLKKWENLGIDVIDAVISDECFEYNTKILTTKGEISIGDIVENSIDVDVLSYNHELKKIEPKPIYRYLYNGNKKTIRVMFSNGVEINCTPEHKYYSVNDNKYKSISLFKKGDKLYYYGKKKKNTNKIDKVSLLWDRIQTKKKFTTVMFSKMFSELYNKRQRKKEFGNKENKRELIPINNKKMLDLSNGIRKFGKIWSKVLFEKLFCHLENVNRGSERKGTLKRGCWKNIKIIKGIISKESEIGTRHIDKNEGKKPNVQTSEHRENEKKSLWSNFSFKGWKWKINKTTINIISRIIGFNGSYNGIFNTNKKTIDGNGGNNYIPTHTLQNRFRDFTLKIGYRNRWRITQKKIMEIFRPTKNRNIEIVWVENIEILESRNRREFGWGGERGEKVFDLEILDNHNYFANGILVSNCHRLKSTKSNTYKNFKRTFTKKIFRNEKISKIFLSGTPAPNRAYELYTVLNQISEIDFPNKKHFYDYYCGMTYDMENGWGYNLDTMNTKFEELYHKIAPFTHRKKKTEVLTDLPDKIYQRVILEMDNKEYSIYNDIESGVVNEFIDKPTSNPLTIMVRLRQYTSYLKTKYIKELITNVLETGEKVVIVDVFKESLNELKELFGDIAVLHTGDEKSLEVRNEMVKQFQDPNSGVRIFLASIQTANYGLTLTAASKLFILILPYSVGEYDQVADRLHRIGQKNVVNIYPLIFPDTIDDYVYSSIESKRQEIVKVIDNEDYKSVINESVLTDVIKKIKEKHGK